MFCPDTGQFPHSLRLARTNSSLLASTSDSSLHRHGGTPKLRRTPGSAGVIGTHPARTPLSDPTGTSSLNVFYVSVAEAVFLILMTVFLQEQVAPLQPQPLVPL